MSTPMRFWENELAKIHIRYKIGGNVEVLAEFNGEPVFIKHGIHYATTFHPELTEDTTVHKLFIESIAAWVIIKYCKTLMVLMI